MAYISEKIKDVVNKIEKGEYILPAIQREFVWKSEQIEKLFDSIMRGYPISSFLYWEIDSHTANKFDFYKFLKNYNQFDGGHNEKINELNDNRYISILDGQQRLTSLYISLKGTYAYKLHGTRYDNKENYPERELYLNITSKSKNIDTEFEFSFKTQEIEESDRKRDDNPYWFRVKDILETNLSELVRQLSKVLIKSYSDEEYDFAIDTITLLHNQICNSDNINFFLEKEQNQDKVLDIFIRTNSGGTKLSYSDLLLSIATAQWESEDTNAREVIINAVDEINEIGDGFLVNKDFVLKSCLLLSNLEISFKVENFTKENMKVIEENWVEIFKSLKLTFRLLKDFGYSKENLSSNNAVIPIAYYIFKRGFDESFLDQKSRFNEDKENIRRWLVLSLMKKAFSGQPDNILNPIRNIISSSIEFPLDEIIENFKGHTKTLVFSDDDIENLVSAKYGQDITFSILSLLYPSLDLRNKFHIDHIHPKSLLRSNKQLREFGFTDDEIYRVSKKVDLLPNLQLLDSRQNVEKSDKLFNEWFEKTCNDQNDYKNRHYIHTEVSLEIKDFEKFFESRKNKLVEKLKEVLQ